MAEPLRLGIAGLGTVGSAVRCGCWRRMAACWSPSVPAAPSRSRRLPRAIARSRGVDLGRFRWYDDPIALAADPEVDVVVGSAAPTARRWLCAAPRSTRASRW